MRGIVSMINFGLYLLSFVANIVIVLTVPKESLVKYIFYYNASSVVSSLSLFFADQRCPLDAFDRDRDAAADCREWCNRW